MHSRFRPQEPHASFYFARPFAQALLATGAEVPGLREYIENLDPTQRYPAALLLQIVDAAVAASGRPDLGLLAAQCSQRGDHELIEYLAVTSKTIRDAIETVNQRLPLVSDGLHGELWIDGDFATWQFRSDGPLSRAAGDFLMAKIYTWAAPSHLDFSNVEVCFRHDPPADLAPYKRSFGTSKLRFSAPEYAFVFPRALIEVSPNMAEPALHSMLVRQADEALSQLPLSNGMTKEVRRIIRANLSREALSADSVAARLQMSRRNLTRRLRDEGTSFSEILDEVRFETALFYLRNTSLTAHEIGLALGFSGRKALARAFRRWSGGQQLSDIRRPQALSGGEQQARLGGREPHRM
jgi:AraC-like DNA-binding protein